MKTSTLAQAVAAALGATYVPLVLAQSFAQVETIEYFDEPTAWVINQVSRRTLDGVETKRVQFGWKALPWKTYSFGQLEQTLAYDSTSTIQSGQLASISSVTDANGNATSLAEWKFGIPQFIKGPATTESPTGAIQRSMVDARGYIVNVTDQVQGKTCYQYDQMGRVTRITYPSNTTANVCDESKWHVTTQAFGQVSGAEYGIPAGHWRRTIRTGNHVKLEYFDALWRPIVTREYDATNASTEAATNRFRRFAYEASGKQTFASYYAATDAITNGTWRSYDLAGRLTSVSQDSEHGVLSTTTMYSSDALGIKTTDVSPRGQQTTTWYQAFGHPSYEAPLRVQHPEGAITSFVRDGFGKPTSITRTNQAGTVSVQRTYAYNGAQRLCKTVEPEVGATLIGHDAVGNVRWTASGLSASIACSANGQEAAISPRRIDMSYNALNKIVAVNFPDGQGNTSIAYTPDGLHASVSADNGYGSFATNTYTYDSRRNIVSERLQWGGDDLLISNVYDAGSNLSSKTLPSGLVVSYEPDALGRPTRAGAFATGVTRFPNGAIKSFAYGNGIVHLTELNARRLPSRSMDCAGIAPCAAAQGKLDFSYTYDKSGNIASITDNVNGSQTRSMVYDGLDRLTSSTSPMFGQATYTYDVLDNLKSAAVTSGLNARNHLYVHDTLNRLGSVKLASTNETIIGIGYNEQGSVNNVNGVLHTFDVGGRLRSIDGKEGGYAYDGFGRRVSAVVGTMNPRFRTFFHEKSGKLVYERSSATSSMQEHVYLDGSIVASRGLSFNIPGGAPSVSYRHTDILGSPVATTNQSQGVVVESKYEPYGAISNRASTNEVGFTGHSHDAASGLAYMQQRYYDPMIGRFLSADPVTVLEGGGFNRYSYGNNNPYRYVDPDGRQSSAQIVDAFMRHYYRNANNKPPANLQTARGTDGWRQLSDKESVFHQQGEDGAQNTKWVDETGHHEAVYDGQGNLVTDRLNGGTYNYTPPDQRIGHTMTDVLPYLIWGNGPIVPSYPKPQPSQPTAPKPDPVPRVTVGDPQTVRDDDPPPPPPPPPEELKFGFR